MLTTEQIRELIKKDDLHRFYIDRAWRKLRRKVLETDKYECQKHKARGEYRGATHVHHINHVKVHPELAMSMLYKDDDGVVRRNLISLCKDCHEGEHPDRLMKRKEPLTPERW